MKHPDDTRNSPTRRLPAPAETLLERALDGNRGTRLWKLHKQGWTEELFDTARRAPRMRILDADLSADLNFVYEVAMPVPCTPRDGELVVREQAVFHLRYCEDWLIDPPAPWEPLGLLEPMDPFHSNMAPALRGAICLGDMGGMLTSASPREILLAGYFAVVMCDIKLDESDPLGVLNRAASAYYRSHPEYLPLTRAGLYDPWDGWKGVS